jgi:hypothetical protein
VTNDFDYSLDTFHLTALDKDTYHLQGKMTSGTSKLQRATAQKKNPAPNVNSFAHLLTRSFFPSTVNLLKVSTIGSGTGGMTRL